MPPPTFRCKTFRSACSATISKSGRASASRSATRCSTAWPRRGPAASPHWGRSSDDALQSRSLNALLALGRGDARAVRLAASRLLRARHAGGCAGRRFATRSSSGWIDLDAGAGRDRRLHRLLRVDRPRDERGTDVPSRRAAPAQLQVRADRLSRPRVVDRRERARRCAGPRGQTRPDASAAPAYGPSQALDYELELGALVCGENAIGETVPIARAEERVFGLCLLNDWSARDMQSWEYQPLGPFLAKNFATTVGAWVVTLDALEPFRTARLRAAGGRSGAAAVPVRCRRSRARRIRDHARGVAAIRRRCARAGAPAVRLSRGLVRLDVLDSRPAAHAPCEQRLQPAAGRPARAAAPVSGPAKASRGCLLELAARGAEPVDAAARASSGRSSPTATR